MKDQQSCISLFVACLTIPSSNWGTSPDITTVFNAWTYGRFIEIHSNHRKKKLHRMNQGSNFFRGSFSNKDHLRAPTQHLKIWFFLRNKPIHFSINSTSVITPVNGNQLIFPALKSTTHFLPQSSVSQIRFKLRSQF